MNIIELNKYIKSIVDQIPIVHSFYTKDVYEVWNSDEIRYGSVSFVITDADVSENTTTYSAVIYYGDRMMSGSDNVNCIQTDAMNVIGAVVGAIVMDDNIVFIESPTSVKVFEQKFNDYIAGGYATMRLTTDNSISDCGYGYISSDEGCEGKLQELKSQIIQLEKEIVEKVLEIKQLNETIEQLREGGIDFSSIGYDTDENKNANETFNNDLKRSQELLEYWNEGNRDTKGFKDIVYAPMWNMVTHWCDSKSSIFNGCEVLRYIPLYDFSSTVNFSFAFSQCTSLITIPQLDTSNVTNMNGTFSNCISLTTIPQLDTSNVTSMYSLFAVCSSLTTIPQLDTSNVTDVRRMFYNCANLESLPMLDFSSVEQITTFFGYSEIKNLTNLGGFKNLKINWVGQGLERLSNLTVESLLNVFNTIADVNDLGGKNLEIGSTNLAKLTEEQIKIATDKGWTLS